MARDPLNFSPSTEAPFSTQSRPVVNRYAPVNKPFRKRRISTFNILFSLVLLALVSVFYVSNIIAVNQLMIEVGELKVSFNNIENMNEILRSEINRKSAMERITKIAMERLGMRYPKQPPIWFEVEDNKPND